MVYVSTIRRDGAGLAPKASRATAPSYQHQISGRSRAGHARGARYVQVLVADYQPQDWMASRHAGIAGSLPTPATCRGSGLGIFPHSHWPFPSLAADRRVLCSSRSIRRNSPVRAVTGCAGAFHSVRFSDCRPSRTNTLAHQLPINRLADVPHVTRRLSKASLRPTHIGRSEKEWRYLISVMRCPK